jgi:carboxymethylenebutenolidase
MVVGDDSNGPEGPLINRQARTTMTITVRTVDTVDGTMKLSTSGSPEASDTAVIVLHQASGISPQITRVAEDLAAAGHYAVAPHLFYRKGVDSVNPMTEFADFAEFDRWLGGDTQLKPDLEATVEDLVSLGFDLSSIGVAGYSYGGRAAYLAAVEWPLGASVTYYGNGIQRNSFTFNNDLQPLTGRPRLTPWLGLYGEEDLSPEEYDELEVAVAAQTEPTGQVVRYPGAGHAFDVEAAFPGRPSPYRADAAVDARRRMLDFFAERLH